MYSFPLAVISILVVFTITLLVNFRFSLTILVCSSFLPIVLQSPLSCLQCHSLSCLPIPWPYCCLSGKSEYSLSVCVSLRLNVVFRCVPFSYLFGVLTATMIVLHFWMMLLLVLVIAISVFSRSASLVLGNRRYCFIAREEGEHCSTVGHFFY